MIGILSDAHGNVEGFRQAIETLERCGATKFYYLGDAVGYIPSIEVVQELIELGDKIICIKGNHEQMVLAGSLQPLADSIYQLGRITDQLTDRLASYLHSWSDHQVLVCNGAEILFVHGGPDNYTDQYIYPDTDLCKYSLKYQFVFMGHTHYPFIKSVNETLFVNVGSCGLPRDDGRYGAAALFNPIEHTVRLIRFRIDQAMSVTFERHNYVHSTVKALSQRRTDKLVGEIV